MDFQIIIHFFSCACCMLKSFKLKCNKCQEGKNAIFIIINSIFCIILPFYLLYPLSVVNMFLKGHKHFIFYRAQLGTYYNIKQTEIMLFILCAFYVQCGQIIMNTGKKFSTKIEKSLDRNSFKECE